MGLLASMTNWFRSSASAGAPEGAMVAHVVGLADPCLRSVPDYQDRLAPAIEHALVYCDRLVAEIPGPIDVTIGSHASDPRVRALFPEAEEIGVALGRSLAVRESLQHFAQQQDGFVHGLLGMRRRRIVDTSASPAASDAVSPIADHTVRSLGSDEAETRRRLTEAAFDGLVIGFNSRWTELCRRAARTQTEQRVESELARAKTSTEGGGPSVHEAHLIQLAQQPTPENMLESLIEWLMFPEEQLRLSGRFDIGSLSLPILFARDRRHWPVCLVRVSVAEAAAALARETRTHRYILI